jgi:hypothetical protein
VASENRKQIFTNSEKPQEVFNQNIWAGSALVPICEKSRRFFHIDSYVKRAWLFFLAVATV